MINRLKKIKWDIIKINFRLINTKKFSSL
jgi:hypothetical protein